MAISHGVNTENASFTHYMLHCIQTTPTCRHQSFRRLDSICMQRILVTLHMSCKGSYAPQTQLLSICTHILVMPASMLETYARRQLSEINWHDHHGSPLQDGDPNLLQLYVDASHPGECTKRSRLRLVYACTA